MTIQSLIFSTAAALLATLAVAQSNPLYPTKPIRIVLAIVVNEAGRFKTLANLLAYARANPRQAQHRHTQYRHHAEPGRRETESEHGLLLQGWGLNSVDWA